MKFIKYMLIMASLVPSAGIMAATPAVPAVGGNPTGTVKINGVIRTSTCSIGSPSTTDVVFNISKADISAAAPGDLLTKALPVTIHVSSCNNTALGMTVTASVSDASSPTHGAFGSWRDPDPQDPNHALYYLVSLKDDPVVSGGDTATDPGYHILKVNGTASPIIIKDTSGSGEFDLSLVTKVARSQYTFSPDKLKSVLHTAYYYTFTYV
ncbi:type 1 fimbrial protein [Salmonella enterica]|nr:type 1 fimbrial protein [Salmonella enterica]EDN4466039.1 type 1 fimbrial protein [Salmonella enterica subsp. enterica]EDW6357163.1 type 1 fimbrial protein [Salmonella enterica subsp. enterica serovar Sandiego]EBO9790343.1 type 1 fimbrial protein [Salmonella enterica]EDS2545991.1 type 1 fimbrial protein [Salmonella enterica]